MSLREIMAQGAQTLADAGLEDSRREARLLLGAALGVGPEVLIGAPERAMENGQRRQFEALISRRAAREPAAYILGQREFWSLAFTVNRATLIPRPDSETLVEAALDGIDARDQRDAPLRLLDFGTGSGCLLLALLSELPCASGLGVDISPDALAVARGNADRLGLSGRARFLCGDWGRAVEGGSFGGYDLIIANPPYIEDREMTALAPEITRFEPASALAGGPDGMACYRALAPDIARLLRPGGCAVIEVGAGQADAVAALMSGQGLVEKGRRRDLAGVERCLLLQC
jgi:release factor glutamine methyltransferase